ncbi:hypothetical protein [Nocardioides sp. NPDC006273]|uniref:hypothetical protein n=1 Tax=Nocardioides sp. NPDC006273 TaxID=3155598 RepID=UPI0033A04A00
MAEAKRAWRGGHRRAYRPWIAEPGCGCGSTRARDLRMAGGVPSFLLTDNPNTVSIDDVAGAAVRDPEVVEVGRHYGTQVHTCVPFDPESEGGSEASARISKADWADTAATAQGCH